MNGISCPYKRNPEKLSFHHVRQPQGKVCLPLGSGSWSEPAHAVPDLRLLSSRTVRCVSSLLVRDALL